MTTPDDSRCLVSPLPTVGGGSAVRAPLPSAGLVELQTSGTWNPLDPDVRRKARLSRMRRAILNASDVVQASYRKGGFRHRAAMVTLTYRPGVCWENRHVSECIRHIRQWLARRGHELDYVWCAELQKRGAVHYHLVIWLPQGLTLPKPDKQRWWRHGMTNICWARRAAGYLAKYASKGEEVREFPKGLRLHGRGGLDLEQRRYVSWWLLPRYVRTEFPTVGTWVTRAIGGGWVNRITGEWFPAWSPPPCPT